MCAHTYLIQALAVHIYNTNINIYENSMEEISWHVLSQ